MLRIEKAVAERDYETFVRLLVSATEDTSVTAKAIADWDASNAHSQSYCQRYAAFWENELVGYGIVIHSSSFEAGRFTVWLTIDEAYRKRGFGQQFYDYLLEAAKEAGADTLTT